MKVENKLRYDNMEQRLDSNESASLAGRLVAKMTTKNLMITAGATVAVALTVAAIYYKTLPITSDSTNNVINNHFSNDTPTIPNNTIEINQTHTPEELKLDNPQNYSYINVSSQSIISCLPNQNLKSNSTNTSNITTLPDDTIAQERLGDDSSGFNTLMTYVTQCTSGFNTFKTYAARLALIVMIPVMISKHIP